MEKSNHKIEELEILCKRALDRFNDCDHEEVSKLYTEETHFMAPNFRLITTRDGVKKFWRNTFGAGYRFEKVETIDIRSGGDMAYWLFKWIMTNPDGKGGKESRTGKNVIIWEKTKQGWLIKLDSWNSPA